MKHQLLLGAIATGALAFGVSSSASAFSVYSGSIGGQTGFYYYSDTGTLLGKKQLLSTENTGSSFFADLDFYKGSPGVASNTGGTASANDFFMKLTVRNTTNQASVAVDWGTLFTNTTFGAGATASSLVGLGIDLLDPSTLANSSLYLKGRDLDTLTSNNISGGTINSSVVDACVANDDNCQGGNANSANEKITAGEAADTIIIKLGGLLSYASAAELEAAYLAAYLGSSQGLIGRFQQVNTTAGSDKVYAGSCIGTCLPPTPDPDPDPVPTPAAVLPILGGLFGAASRRKKGESTEA